MLGLSPELDGDEALEILCIGAHCDDIEIGCGATLLTLQRRYACRIHWAVLCSTSTRRVEAERAMRTFVRSKFRGLLRIGEFPDGHLPAQLSEAKTFLEAVRKEVDPDLLFTAHERDRHQDHRLTNQITWQSFRNHTVLEYEIPKYDGDLHTPNLYVPLAADIAARKSRAILRLYGSQRDKHWFTAETFHSLMRLRGIECRADSGYAEAFHCRKLVLGKG